MRILVAEDDWTSRQLLQKTLSRWGHEVVPAADGCEAWRAYCEAPYSIVISDWVMPVIDGLEFCRRVRRHSRSGYTYFILLTVKADRDSLLQGFEAGADDFLSKPFDPAELSARLRSAERVLHLEWKLAGQLAELARANEKMKRDLAAAAAVQESLLPERAPDNGLVRFAWRLTPCEELAGDTFNLFRLDENTLGLYLLDVSGHGVASSLLSVALSRLLSPGSGQGIVLRPDDSGAIRAAHPGEVLERLNDMFQMRERGDGQYFTIIYATINLAERTMTFCQAGHPPPLRCTPGNVPEYYAAQSLPIGFVPDPGYEPVTVTLEPGERWLFYSDGLVDGINNLGEPYGPSRLAQRFEEKCGVPLVPALEGLLRDTTTWLGGSDPEDDISLIMMQVLDKEECP